MICRESAAPRGALHVSWTRLQSVGGN